MAHSIVRDQLRALRSATEGDAWGRGWKGAKPSLTRGRYLLKVHVDTKERLKSDWNASLGDAELVGEAIIDSEWPAGYGQMTVVEATELRRTTPGSQ